MEDLATGFDPRAMGVKPQVEPGDTLYKAGPWPQTMNLKLFGPRAVSKLKGLKPVTAGL